MHRTMHRVVAVVILAFTFAIATPAVSALASPQLRRVTAIRWAEHHAYGHWYCWGGSGPSCYDCSGLVMTAYEHAGIYLPHNTVAMLDSGMLQQVSRRKRGDLAFYGTGHVELVTNSGTFGALETGTRVGWHHPSGSWRPTMYFRVRL